MLMSAADRAKLRDELEQRLTGDVVLTLTVDETEASRNAVAIIDELTHLSPKLSQNVEMGQKGKHLPSIVVRGDGAHGKLRFTGLPTGYEFPTLVEAVLAASTGRTTLSRSSLESLGALRESRSLQVFTTPT